MSPLYRRFVVLAVGFLLLLTPLASAAAVEALFDLASTVTGPFPSDRFTLFDHDNKTGLRMNLPRLNCSTRPTDCADVDVINTLDGFNLQPRLSIPFSGSIDVSSVSSSTVFLVRVGDGHGRRSRHVVGINQVVWDPATNTLHAESDEFLYQHTRYLLVVTDGVLDSTGGPVGGRAFKDFLDDDRDGDGDDGHDRDSDHRRHRDSDRRLAAYRDELRDAVKDARLRDRYIVAASVFTTQSATAVLEKIRQQIKSSHPAPATMLGTFARATVTAIDWRRQVGTASFETVPLPVTALDVFPGSVGAIAFGRFVSPDWETSGEFIPPIGTRTGVPVAQGTNTLYFNLFIPSGTPPADGWPVAIFGHGFTDSKQGAPIVVASTFAHHGIATIAINVVGHRRGALGTLTIKSGQTTLATIPDGGRGIDQDGNGTIDSTEGVNAVAPRAIIGNRDGMRQTVADLMQSRRVIQTGGLPGLSGSHTNYTRQSFCSIYGVKFLALEDSVRAGVANVPGGPIIEIARLSPSFRILGAATPAARVPSLLNALPFAAPAWGFNENIPLRDLPPVINTVPGAMAIQEVLDNTEWVSQSGNPVAYAPHLRKSPLNDIEPPPVIIQFAKGDQTVPNPTASAIFRAGDLTDRSTYFRNDLVRAARPSPPFVPSVPANPHTFLTNIGNATVADLAIAAQQQIAIFLESDGIVIVDPDGAGPFFEVPIKDPLPETLNF